jgi:hypothetical protein
VERIDCKMEGGSVMSDGMKCDTSGGFEFRFSVLSEDSNMYLVVVLQVTVNSGVNKK